MPIKISEHVPGSQIDQDYIGYSPSRKCQYISFLEAVRWVNGLRELEAVGIVELVTFDMEKHVICHSILEGCDLFYHKK